GEFSLDEHDDDSVPFDLEADGLAPDSQLIGDERAEAVRRALVELAEPYRVVVVLRHYEGLKFREIGDVLGIPEGTVKSRMSEALTQLSKRLNSLLSDEPRTAPRSRERLLI